MAKEINISFFFINPLPLGGFVLYLFRRRDNGFVTSFFEISLIKTKFHKIWVELLRVFEEKRITSMEMKRCLAAMPRSRQSQLPPRRRLLMFSFLRKNCQSLRNLIIATAILFDSILLVRQSDRRFS